MPLPEHAYRFSDLVLLLADATVDDLERMSGSDHLMWFHEWSMWGDLRTSIGIGLVDHLRLGHAQDAATDQEPAMLFSGSEIGALISFALVPLVFGWDFYLVPASAEYFVFGSHDEWIGFSGKDEAIEATLARRIQDWGGSPERSTHYCLAGIGAG
jgi:hypothetical protein